MSKKTFTFQPRKCSVCEAEFVPHSGNAKYCQKCLLDVKRKQNAERVRRWRSKQRNTEVFQ